MLWPDSDAYFREVETVSPIRLFEIDQDTPIDLVVEIMYAIVGKCDQYKPIRIDWPDYDTVLGTQIGCTDWYRNELSEFADGLKVGAAIARKQWL